MPSIEIGTKIGEVADDLTHRIPALLTEHDLPGIAVAICDATSIVWSAGFGVRRSGDDNPVTAQTTFSVQSCSKMYTATAVLLAVQEGLVDLDVPVGRYLPEFRVNSSFEDHPERSITMRHLLSHTAGLTHEAPVGSNYLVGRETFEAHCQSISETWLRFPVGHHFEYSNLGIDLAGYVLQRSSGVPFHEFVRRVLLAPLGLERTTFDQRTILRDPERATGHTPGIARVPVRVPMVAAGGLYTNTLDACRFLQLHLDGGGRVIGSGLLADMYRTPGDKQRDEGYGLGVALARAGDVPVRGHGGGGFGFLSDMYWVPAAKIGVVVLTNSTGHPLQWQLLKDIVQGIVPQPAAESSRRGPSADPPHPLPSTIPAGVAGHYTGRGQDQVTFAVSGDRGSFDCDGRRQTVEFVGPLRFRVDQSSAEEYRFSGLDDTGRPAYLESMTNGRVWYRNDVPAPAPAQPEGPWNRDYVVRASGTHDGIARLRDESGVQLFDHWGGGTVRLQGLGSGRYLSATGEVLDLTRVPPTYANVRLHPT